MELNKISSDIIDKERDVKAWIYMLSAVKPALREQAYLWVGRVGDCVSSRRIGPIAGVIQHIGQTGALPWSERWEWFVVL